MSLLKGKLSDHLFIKADIIIELENDVAKARKQEKVYEDAIEQLQAEQDALEFENARLRKGQGQNTDKQGEIISAPFPDLALMNSPRKPCICNTWIWRRTNNYRQWCDP